MSTGAGMLFLFRVGASAYGFLPLLFFPPPALHRVPQVPLQGRPDPDTQTGRAYNGIRQGAGSTGPEALPPAVFILILVLLTDDNEKVSSGPRASPPSKGPDMLIYCKVQNQFQRNLKLYGPKSIFCPFYERI